MVVGHSQVANLCRSFELNFRGMVCAKATGGAMPNCPRRIQTRMPVAVPASMYKSESRNGKIIIPLVVMPSATNVNATARRLVLQTSEHHCAKSVLTPV